jgi:hypothetical protein
MRKNKILDNYLTYLHEQTAEIALFVLIMVAQALLNSVELYESLAKNDKTSIKKIIDKTILEKNDN